MISIQPLEEIWRSYFNFQRPEGQKNKHYDYHLAGLA